MSDCSICCEKFNKSSRKEIKCHHCSYSSCASCNQTYLLDSVHEPHCTNCRKTWTLAFMNANFTQVFLTKELRARREIVYFKEEETHFPELLPIAEQRKKLNAFDEEIRGLENAIALNDAKEDQLVSDQRSTLRRLCIKKKDVRQKRYTLLTRDVAREKRHVVMKCPLGECKGFLDTKMYCGMCDSHVCRECHVKKNGTKDDTHLCNPDDVATVHELERSTKPCPNCHARIFKTDGCDQMFCTMSHPLFLAYRKG